MDERIERIVVSKQSHPELGRSAARNVEAFKSTKEFVGFVDDDGRVCDGWDQEMLACFAKGFDVVAGHEIRLGRDVPRVPLYVKGQDVSFPACNLAFRTEVFQRLNGFDESLDYGEDMDILLRAVRAGYSIGHADEAVFYHQPRDTVAGFLIQSFWYGFGRARLEQKHGRLLPDTRLERVTPWLCVRLVCGVCGYLYGKMHPGFHEDGTPITMKEMLWKKVGYMLGL